MEPRASAPAGRLAYFDSLTQSSSSISYTLLAPDGGTVTSANTYYDNGPFILPLSGTYTLILNNTSGSAITGTFNGFSEGVIIILIV